MRIAIVCEPQTQEAYEQRIAMDRKTMAAVRSLLAPSKADLKFIFLCPPVKLEDKKSDARTWDHVKSAYGKDTLARIADGIKGCDAILTLGKLALRAATGSAQQITKVRGVLQELHGVPLFPTIQPSQALYDPGAMPTLETDLRTFVALTQNGFQQSAISTVDEDCRWCFDMSDWRRDKPRFICLDTETYNPDRSALRVCEPGLKIITIQLAARENDGRVVPSPFYFKHHRAWFKEHFPEVTEEQVERVYRDALDVCEDRTIKKTGHNLAYDLLALQTAENVKLRGWVHETLMLSHYLDQDSKKRDLSGLIRRYVPKYAGYADMFDRAVDKGNMLAVPPDQMLPYAGGDAVAGLALCKVLANEVHKDPQNWAVYKHISMPGCIAFAHMKSNGLKVNRDTLRKVRVEMLAKKNELYAELIRTAPKKALNRAIEIEREKRQEARKTPLPETWAPDLDEVWKFSRPEFTKLILFSEYGFKLKPLVYTDSTADLEDEDDREPSVSTKQHLPYFAATDNEDTGYKAKPHEKFVAKLIEFLRIDKLLSTYVGDEFHRPKGKDKPVEPNGMWQYLSEDGYIHPSFTLWGTNTGRTSSQGPNAQNFPVKNAFAKPFLKCFDAPEGYVFICADLSQIELRIAACESGDTAMIQIYKNGLDIHEITGMVVANLNPAEWKELDPGVRKRKRGDAKPVNFGFLYGMWWKKFKVYAFTSYGVTFTDAEAEAIRTRFFQRYPGLPRWHEKKKREVYDTGGVRSLHGVRRNLPSIYSRDEARRKSVERQAINATVQRFGSDLGVAAAARLQAQAPSWFKLIGFVHDALYALVPKDKVKEGVETLVWAMESVPLKKWFNLELQVPVVSEPDVGLSWGEKVELAEMKKPEEFAKLKEDHWFREWDAKHDLRGYTPQKPSWWRDELEMMGAEAFDVERDETADCCAA